MNDKRPFWQSGTRGVSLIQYKGRTRVYFTPNWISRIGYGKRKKKNETM